MEVNKNIVICSVLVIVTLLVVFNLDMFTGEATRQGMTSVQVVPDAIEAGDYINVHIEPGSRCAQRKILIYNVDRNFPVASYDRSRLGPWGGYRFCNPTVAVYKSWSTWHGNYSVWVKDIGSDTYVKVPIYIE